MKFIKIFEEFENEYYDLMAKIIKSVIIKLHYDTNRPKNDMADILIKQGISKPMSTKIAHYLFINNRFDPSKIDNYIDNVINYLKPNDSKPTFTFSY